MSSQNNDPLIGRIIAGKIRIDDLLGAGATGSVYRADHLTLAKSVAIKVLHSSHSADPNLVRRFRAEARAASRLDHPNSVRILDFGEEADGLLYLAMEFLDGEDLQTIVDREGPLDPTRVVSIMVQVSAALSVAHEQGIIHRDMKPGNIMLIRDEDDRQEVVKVCDFGLAKILDVNPEDTAGGPLTKQGMIFGTPTYMSPEQASGSELDARTDIYSCGVIMYRMITGVPPFVAESTTGMLMKHIMEEPLPVRERNPACDPRIAQIVERAMKKAREARYASMKEMFDDLRAVMSGQPLKQPSPRGLSGSRAFAPPLPDRLPSNSPSIPIGPPERSPLAIAIIGSIALVLVGGLGTYLLLGSGEPPPPPRIEIVAPPVAVAPDPPVPPPIPAPIPPPVIPPPVEAPPIVAKRIERTKTKIPEPRVDPPVAPPVETPPPPVVEAPPPPVVAVVAPEPPPVAPVEPPPAPPPPGPKKLGSSFDFEATLERLNLRGGISSKQMQAALARTLSEMRPCLREAVAKNGIQIAGGVDVSGVIGSRGRFQMLEVKGGVPGASGCVEGSLRSARMPPADTGDVYVSFRVGYSADP